MARNLYRMNFKDKTIMYSNMHDSSFLTRVLDDLQLEIMQLLFFSMEELHFNCVEEEFYNTLTPHYLESLREIRSNQFKLVHKDD